MCLALCCCLPQVDVRVVSTEHAKHFYDPADVSVKVYSDKDEWEVMMILCMSNHFKLTSYPWLSLLNWLN